MKVGALENVKHIEVVNNLKGETVAIKFVAMYYNPSNNTEQFFGVVLDADTIFSVNERTKPDIRKSNKTNEAMLENLIPTSDSGNLAIERVYKPEGSYIKLDDGTVYSTYAPIDKLSEIFVSILIKRNI